MAGTGLPIPKSGDVRTQTPNIVSMDGGARAWAQIAQAGEEIGKAGFNTWQIAEHQARVGYLADQEVDIARKQIELRDKNSFNPTGFDADWKGYTDGKLGEAQPWAVDHLKRTLGQKGNAAYSGVLGETRARDESLHRESISKLTAMSGNDVIGSAMAGTLSTPEGRSKVAQYRGVLQSAVTSGLHTQEWADLHLDDTLSKAEGELAARDGVAIYREKGFDAAVDHLRKSILENQELTLKGESRHKAFDRGLSAIRLQQASDKKDREEVVTVSRDLRARIESNQPIDPSEVRDTLTALQRSGAAAEFHRLSVSSSVAAATSPYRSGLSLREFAGAVSIQRTGLVDAVKRFEGFAPTAKWDVKQFSVGYGRRGRAGEVAGDDATETARLNVELGNAAAIVDRSTPNLPPGVRDAMISLTFNAGSDWVSSGLGDRLRAGDYQGAKAHFLQYNKAGGEFNQGLANRRAQEAQWFDMPGGAVVGDGGPAGAAGVPFSGEVTKRVQEVFVKQARVAWPDFKRLIDSGKVLDHEDFNSIRYAAALSGDANWQQEVEALAIANKVSLDIRDMPEGQRQAALDKTSEEMRKAGLPVLDQATVNDSLRKQFDRQNKMVREDPIGYAVERGASAPDPLNFSSPEAASAGVAQRVKIARGVAADQGTYPGTPFRPAEIATIASSIGSGDVKQATVAMDAIFSLPDEMLTSTLADRDIKAAVTGAARSGDAARYNASMTFMDRVWTRARETATAAFGTDAIHDLMTWQSNNRYMSGEQLAKERDRNALDPQVRSRMEVNEKKGRDLARKQSVDDVVKQFDTSWWPGTAPAPPLHSLARDALMGDFENIYARRYASTLNEGEALKQTHDLMKIKWTRSDVNGGKLMLNAPETVRGPDGKPYYPADGGGSHSWMNDQIEADIATELGKPRRGTVSFVSPASALTFGGVGSGRNWDYEIVPDRQTEAEAQNGQRPTYNVVVKDGNEGWKVLPRRFKWDPTGAKVKARSDFDQQNNRAIDQARAGDEPTLGNLGLP